MSTAYGFVGSNDATAARQGAPVNNNNLASDDEKRDIQTAEDEKPPKTASETEGGTDEPIHEKTSSPAETLGNDDDDSEMERRTSIVQALARSYSHASAAHEAANPFLSDENSPLNPNSPNFSGREWAKAVVAMVQQDGAAFRSAGVCFQNLNVFGYGGGSDYQSDVANVWLSAATDISRILGGKRQRIDILRNFDGVVHKGEMLVVLGPPGSGCSTLLKTIAGETNGIYVDDGSYFNYQGKFETNSPFNGFASFSSGLFRGAPVLEAFATPKNVGKGVDACIHGICRAPPA